MGRRNASISCSFCVAEDWFDFGVRLLNCVAEMLKPIPSKYLYTFSESDPDLPCKLTKFWTLCNCFLSGKSRNGLRLAAAFCYISHYLYHNDLNDSDMEVLTEMIFGER